MKIPPVRIPPVKLPPVKMPRMALGDTQLLLLLSILIGVASGLLVVCFHIAIDAIRWSTYGLPGVGGPIATVISPALGAIVAASLVRYVFRDAKGSGVIHTKAAVHISDGVVPASTVPGKFLACAVSLGSGNSLGPEDPSLQMGAGIASIIGRAFGLARDHRRLIAPVGAAAGIAAAFNTPITAVLFVIEEVIGSWNASVLGSILLSAVSAVVVNRWYLGDEPLFRVPALGAIPPSDLVIYAVIGVIGGLASGLYVRLMLSLKRRSAHVRNRAICVMLPGIAGLIVGIVGLWLPQVMGPGYITIDSALHDRFNWQTLFVLALAKIALTSFCFASGTPGGLFAPTLFAGAMIGGGIGALAQQYWPFPQAAPGAFVLVGMGTFFAGVFRAPMTSIFMVFEVTASYQIILPVMVANTVGYLVARQSRVHLFDELARDEGVDLPSVQEERELREFHVEDAMSGAAVIVGPGVSLAEAREKLSTANQPCLLVQLGPVDFAAMHKLDLEALQAADGATPLEESSRLPPAPHLYPDLGLEAALKLFGSHPALPVVRRNAHGTVVGILTLEDVARALRIERRAGGWPMAG